MYEPDPETIRAAVEGDVRAFEEIVAGFQGPVWRFLSRVLGDAALAEDVAQEAFLRVHRRLDTYRFRSRFSTWLFQIARNAGIDAIRSRERRQRLLEAVPAATAQPATAELSAELQAALASLPEHQRAAFLVVEMLELRYREAAEVLGVPEGTVKSRVFHARQALVAWFEAEEAADEA